MERGGSWETLLTSPASLPIPYFALSQTPSPRSIATSSTNFQQDPAHSSPTGPTESIEDFLP